MDNFLLSLEDMDDLQQKVLVDGKLHHISEFTGDKKRPITLCPICKEHVSLKLGSTRIHHYAHRPDSACPISTGETLIHFNSKMHIANQLRTSHELWILHKCVSCSENRKVLLVSNWDEVCIEYRIGNIRADIALLYQGEVIAVIEILVSHAVDPEKAEILKNIGIKWIEVKVTPSIYRDPFPWHPQLPLLVQQIGPYVEDWTCKGCLSLKLIPTEPAFNYNYIVQEELGKNVMNGEHIHARGFLDCLHPDNKRTRDRLCLIKTWVQGNCISMRIETAKKEVIASVEGSNEKAQVELKRRFAEYISGLRAKHIIPHSPIGWVLNEDVPE